MDKELEGRGWVEEPPMGADFQVNLGELSRTLLGLLESLISPRNGSVLMPSPTADMLCSVMVLE